MSDPNRPLRINAILLGNPGVGKSTLGTASTQPNFKFDPKRHIASIGVDFTIKSVTHGKEELKMMIWDTGNGRGIVRTSIAVYRVADVVMICFDLSDRDSFKSVERWADDVQKNAPEAVTVLLGTKADLRETTSNKPAVVNFEEGVGLAAKIGAHKYLEVSSKTKEGIDDMFDDQLIEKALELAKRKRHKQSRQSKWIGTKTLSKNLSKEGIAGHGPSSSSCTLL
uniref:Ras-related protein Rab n=1 Tax=Lotharella globosa TaxID=91324 RepID=A0A6V3JFS7_9EUKA